MIKVNLAVTAFIATARRYLGYQAELLGRTSFGERVGYPSQPWAGAFVDVVLRESGLREVPSFVYTPTALTEFQRNGLVHKNPRPGDIAIFGYASNSGHTASAFSAPHCGIVIDTREFRSNGRFLTIEGNTIGSTVYTQVDGVHQKMHHAMDVIAFCRPAQFQTGVRKLLRAMSSSGHQLLTKARTKLNGELQVDRTQLTEAASSKEGVRVKLLRTGTRNRSIELVQLALSQVTDLHNCERGKWDGATASAFANFQRTIGYVGQDASGSADLSSLQRLAKATGLFTAV